MATRSPDETRPSRLPDGSPMDYAPENELGVVFLFSHVARLGQVLNLDPKATLSSTLRRSAANSGHCLGCRKWSDRPLVHDKLFV
jgi:hypothetical protein